jgi:glyoxylase-like metal-dependent hydrolase (beta-lactamase superfamily II)
MAQAHQPSKMQTIADLPLEQVSNKTYLVTATLEKPSKSNQGFIANAGFIVTSMGVVVVDPGSSVQIGRELLNKIATVTPAPVVAVINTHVHGDHWLGNQAIIEKHPNVVIYAHEKMIQRLNEGEGKLWLEIMEKMTEGSTAGTIVVPPNAPLKGGETIEFGNTKLNIYYKGKAHTDTDIMIEVVSDATLFLGDIVEVGRLTSRPQDANIAGQIAAIRFALQTDNKVFIPGHGESGNKQVLRTALEFLIVLQGSVKKYYEEGLSASEMKNKVIADIFEYKEWVGFDQIGRTIGYIYLEVEEASFNE